MSFISSTEFVAFLCGIASAFIGGFLMLVAAVYRRDKK